MARALVVEDEAVAAQHLEDILKALGHDVVGVAADAGDALYLAKLHAPDLALVDVMIEGERDGVSLALDLRQECDLALIFVTSLADKATVSRAAAVRPNGYIVKPFSRAMVYATVESALANFEASQSILDPGRLIRALEASEGLPQQTIRDVKRFVEHNIDRPITICELARVAQLGASHFGRQFKAATGLSPYQYVVLERIEEGKRLLRSTSWSVIQIAQAVGFESHAHFSTMFKKYAGVSPSEWRRI